MEQQMGHTAGVPLPTGIVQLRKLFIIIMLLFVPGLSKAESTVMAPDAPLGDVLPWDGAIKSIACIAHKDMVTWGSYAVRCKQFKKLFALQYPEAPPIRLLSYEDMAASPALAFDAARESS